MSVIKILPNRKLDIPNQLQPLIGVETENVSEKIAFQIPLVVGSNGLNSFTSDILLLTENENFKDEIILTEKYLYESDGYIKAYWVVERKSLISPILKIQIKVADATADKVWITSTRDLFVQNVIDSDGEISNTYPTILDQFRAEINTFEQLITNMQLFEVYNNDTEYVQGNKVSFNGSSFVAKKTTQGNEPTLSPTDENWLLVCSKGDQGFSLQYDWDGTSLGVKREDEAEFTYVDLKGEIGLTPQEKEDFLNGIQAEYEGAENARDALYVDREDARDSLYESREDDRDGFYASREADRDTFYEEREIDRDNLYEGRETDRDNLYNAQELVREGLYETQELVRDGLYTTAESGRDNLYEAQELVRDGLYDTAEGNRDTQYEAQELVRDELFEDAEEFRNTWEAFDELKIYVVGEKVYYAPTGSSYALHTSSGVAGTLPTDTNFWQIVVQKGDTGEVSLALFEPVKLQTDTNARDITRIEQDLATLNPNNDGLIVVNTENEITTLPANAPELGMTAESRGVTLNQLVTNGDFSNGTTGWTSVFSTKALTAGTKVLFAEGNGLGLIVGARQQTVHQYNTGDVICITATCKVTNADCVTIRLGYGGSVSGGATDIIISSPVINQIYKVSKKFTLNSGSGNLFVQALHYYADSATANGKVMEIKDVMTYNLTQAGATALTESQISALTPQYFAGTQSALTSAFLSVGKNLFDGKLALGTINTSTGINEASTTTVRSVNFIRIRPSTAKALTNVTRWFTYDINKNFLATGTTATLTTGATAAFMRVIRTSTDLESQIQIEQNATATSYEAPKRSIQFTEPFTMRRTSAGIADSIENGNYIQRVGTDGIALATPVTTYNVQSGLLKSFPRGTLYRVPYLPDADIYGSNFAISRTSYPIKSLVSLRKYNPINGTETELDVATAVIAVGGLTFTHPSLAFGDVVFAVYERANDLPNPFLTYKYKNGRDLVIDSVNSKVWRITPTVANGVLTWTPVEVT